MWTQLAQLLLCGSSGAAAAEARIDLQRVAQHFALLALDGVLQAPPSEFDDAASVAWQQWRHVRQHITEGDIERALVRALARPPIAGTAPGQRLTRCEIEARAAALKMALAQ